jgi:hypothetical protein
VAFLGGFLAFEHNGLELFKDNKLLVGVVNLGVALFFTHKKPGFFEAFELALNVAGVFFDKLGETTHVSFKVGVFGIDNDNLAAHSAGDENV